MPIRTIRKKFEHPINAKGGFNRRYGWIALLLIFLAWIFLWQFYFGIPKLPKFAFSTKKIEVLPMPQSASPSIALIGASEVLSNRNTSRPSLNPTRKPFKYAVVSSLHKFNVVPAKITQKMGNIFIHNNQSNTMNTTKAFSEVHEPFILKSSDHTLEWIDQRPIGSGRIGALVGGTLTSEVIPLSMEGFFVIRGYSGEQDSSGISANFQSSRDFFTKGDLSNAQEKLHGLQKSQPPLGTFQYISDLTFIYSSYPLVARHGALDMVQGSKGGLVAALTKMFTLSDNTNHGFGPIERSYNDLNTKTGVATTQFMVDDEDGVHRTHRRVWFASVVDNLIVGKVECISNKKETKGCLHTALRVSRLMGGLTEMLGEDMWKIADYNTSSPPRDGDNHIKLIHLNLEADPNGRDIHKPVFMCGAIVCQGIAPHMEVRNDNRKYVICDSAESMEIMIAIQSLPSWTLKNDLKNSPQVIDSCWQTVMKGLGKGYNAMKFDHEKDFVGKMTQTEMSFMSHERSTTRLNGCFDANETSKQLSCLANSVDRNANHDRAVALTSKLLTADYWYSKYLLLSSSGDSVSNLQGLWADGPASAWSGDYHLNINLQMNYWAANTVFRKKTVVAPLIEFIKKMSISGKSTASSMYKCKGWVGHGFTDNFLDMGVRGGPMWAMCVTCGAWMALHLWEYVTFENDMEVLINYLIPIFRSTAQFFLDHMFLGSDGFMHTGPSTSPENSYIKFTVSQDGSNIVKSDGPFQSDPNRYQIPGPDPRFYFVTISPAIDISVLRQTAVAYDIALQWAIGHDIKNAEIFKTDLQIAQNFLSIVNRMPGQAVPVVSELTNKIKEYPYDPPNCVETKNPNVDLVARNKTCGISEEFDLSHRHFSGMHWLYPGTFLPEHVSSKKLYKAAENTVLGKIAGGGGHTGWSAAWEANLWSRLRKPDRVWNALQKLLLKYSTKNLMKLHPPLSGVYQSYQCATCFYELLDRKKIIMSKVGSKIGERNMELADNSKFQIDANNGMLAALVECVIQSHIPTIVHLLPSLPSQLSKYGFVKDIRARGDIDASFQWTNNVITQVKLRFNSNHMWLKGFVETTPGFFRATNSSSPSSITVISPNVLYPIYSSELFSQGVNSKCASIVSTEEIPSQAAYVTHINDHYAVIRVLSFPCEVFMCDTKDRQSCLRSFSIE